MATLVMDKICITFDIDWAPDEVVESVTNVLEEHRAKATFFATHRSDLLRSLDSAKYEVGIHPNFDDRTDNNEVIRELKAIYPEAIGVRSHGLFCSTNILQICLANGLKYDVNTFIPLREGLYPFTRLNRLNKIICIPYYWEDDTHFTNQTPFELSKLELHKEGLKIYNFHPIHIFMNTESQEHYADYKAFYLQPDTLRKYRNMGGGTRTLFIALLKYISDNAIQTYTCKEIYDEYCEREKTAVS